MTGQQHDGTAFTTMEVGQKLWMFQCIMTDNPDRAVDYPRIATRTSDRSKRGNASTPQSAGLQPLSLTRMRLFTYPAPQQLSGFKSLQLKTAQFAKKPVDPVRRWTGNQQGDFVAIDFGNAGDVKFTNPDGSVSGTWQLLRDGRLQITLRNAGASFHFKDHHSATLNLGTKRIIMAR